MMTKTGKGAIALVVGLFSVAVPMLAGPWEALTAAQQGSVIGGAAIAFGGLILLVLGGVEDDA